MRDERILELWKQDQEKPSVYELVQSMKKRRESDNTTANQFNNLLSQAQDSSMMVNHPFPQPKGSLDSIHQSDMGQSMIDTS